MINGFACLFFYFGIKLQVIGLTGGIACGKSSAAKLLIENGFIIIDSDQISKDLRAKDKHYQKLLVKTFGPEIWENEQINSEKLGAIVFSDPKKRS